MNIKSPCCLLCIDNANAMAFCLDPMCKCHQLTHKEVASSGGKKRWAGYTPEQRKKMMEKVWSKRKKKGVDNSLDSSTTVC